MKKLLLFMFALLAGVSGVWAQITVSPSTGVYWKGGAETSDAWAPQWKSNAKATDGTTSLLVFTGETGMNTATGDIYSNQTYTLEAPSGYVISGYSFNGTATGGDVTITPSGESGTTITSGNSLGSPLDVTVMTQSTTFALSGDGHIESLVLEVTVFPMPVIIANCPDYVKDGACSHSLPSVYGSFSGQTYTTGDASNLAGVTVTASSGLTIGEQTVNANNYGKCFKLVTAAASTDYTVTMTAPTGYVITGYYLGCSANTSGAVHTLTSADGSVSVVASAPPYNSPNGPKVFEVTGLNANSTSFTINTANNGNTLYLPQFYIYVAKEGEASVVTYNVLLTASGAVKATTTKTELIGRTISLPSGLARDYCTYTYYSDAACTSPLTTVPNATSATVYALAAVNTPFAVSTSFAEANWHYATLRGKHLRADDSAKDGSGRYSTNGTNEKTDAYKWAFFGNPYDNFYVMNKNQGDGKYMAKSTQIVFSSIADPTADNTALWAITPNSNGGFTLRNIDGGSTWYVNDSGNGGNLGFWNNGNGANDAGGNWVVSAPNPVDITYSVILTASGTEKATATTVDVSAGSTLALPASAAKDYCTYTYYSDAACTDEITTAPSTSATVYALAAVNTPFAVSTSFAEANWHYATLRGKYLRADDDAKDGSDRYSTNSTNEKTDAYKWAFFGNPYDNFYVMNKNQGDGKYLYQSTKPSFETVANPTADNNALWAVSVNSTGGFSLRSISGGSNWYINDESNAGNLGSWNSSWSANDAGSNWVVITDVTYNVILEPSGAVKATATAENVGAGSALALPSSAAKDLCTYTYYSDAACTDEITTAPSTSATVYALCSSAIKSAASFGTINTWYQVRMHSNQTHYMYNNSGALAFNGSFTASDDYVWGFVGNPYDGFKLYNRGAGSTVAVDNENPCTLSAAGTSVNFNAGGNFHYIGEYNSTADVCFTLYVSSGSYLNYQSGAIKRWGDTDEGSTFMINEVRDVNYVLYFGASPVGLQSTIQKVGSATAIPTPLDYCTFAYSDPTIVSGSGAQTVNVTVTMDAPFVPTKYYAWHLMEGNNPGYMYTDGEGNVLVPNNGTLTLTNPIPSAYVWEFTGDPVQGFLIQNMLETSSKTLGGRTASGGTITMETLNGLSSPRFVPKYVEADRNKWYCQNYNYWIDRSSGKPYAHTGTNYPSTYVRLYKVHFDKGSAPATLKVGTEEIADPSVDIYLSASATMSCKEDGNYITSYDGYETLAEALAADDDGVIELGIVTSETSVASTDQNKAYNIRTADSRGWWAVASGASVVNSTVGLDIATLSSDTKQQFAFIPIDLDDDDNVDEYYLYSIGEQKFVYFNCRSNSGGQIDTHLTLSTAPVKSAVTFTASTNSTHKAVYPNVMTFPYGTGGAGRSFGVHPSHSPQVYNYAHDNTHLDDAGNASSVVEVGAFDPTTALSRLPISSTSSLANNKAYAITSPRGVLGISNRTLISTASPIHTYREHTYAGGAAASITDPTYTEGTFAIITHNDGVSDKYYLWSIEGHGYVNSNGVIDNATPEPIEFTSRGNRVFSIYYPGESSKYINLTAWGDNANGLNIDTNSGLDDGNRFYICPVDDFDPTDAINIFTPQTVDYVLMYGGDEVDRSEDVSARVSATAEDFFPSSLDNGFMTYTFDPEIITGETATVTVTATWNGPFEIAASFNAATAKWYTVGMHTSYEEQKWTWGYKSGESDKVKVEQLPVNDIVNLDNTRLFTFVGDPYSGFYIYNRAAGTKKLYRGGESDEISMTNDGEKFFVAKSRPNPDTQTYFCLIPDGAANYLNMNTGADNAITGYNDNDNASTCWVLPSGSYYLNALTPLVLDAPVGAVGSKSGILTTSDRDALNTLRTELGTDAFAVPSTYDFGMVKPVATAVLASDIITLTDGGYYRIVSAVPGFNQTAAWYYNPSESTTHITWAKAATTATHQINSLFKFEASATDGKWYIYSPNAQKYLIHDGSAFGAQTGKLGDTPGDVTVGVVTGSTTQKTLQINVQTVHANGHASGSGNSGTLINYNSNDVGGASTWYLVKVDKIDLTLNKATDLNGRTNVYATAKMPFNITLPTGDDTEAMAYTMLAENQATNAGGVLYIKPDELGRRVPKDTPVMLVGTSTGAASQTVKATISDGDMSDVDVPGSNIFEGTYVPLTSNYGSDATKYLTLGRNKEGETKVVGFYLLSEGSSIAANRAYIPYSTLHTDGVKGFAIAWDFDWDGIENLTEDVKDEKSNVYYDLQGRRVMKPRKGIYIVDGNKVMIK